MLSNGAGTFSANVVEREAFRGEMCYEHLLRRLHTDSLLLEPVSTVCNAAPTSARTVASNDRQATAQSRLLRINISPM